MGLLRRRNRKKKPGGRRFELPKLEWSRAGRVAGAVAVLAIFGMLLAVGLDQPVRSIVIDGPFQRVAAVEVMLNTPHIQDLIKKGDVIGVKEAMLSSNERGIQNYDSALLHLYKEGKIDIEEALSFEGETGPYLQYAVVRARNILAKLEERDQLDEAAIVAKTATLDRGPLDAGDEALELWNLVLEAGRLDEMVESAVRALELSVLAKYAFGLAQAFNAFYHRQQILREDREDARLWRAAAVVYFRRQMTKTLDVMGCGVPDRM